MKLFDFKSYEQYLQAQYRTAMRKGKGPYFCPVEIDRIADHMISHGQDGELKGICHGARCGTEVNEFIRCFPQAAVYGTDLLPKNPTVIKRDFSIPFRKWVGYFDFVYSNSLDHARYPDKTLAVWTSQLKSGGRMFLQWSWWHRNIRGGDCFGASLDEYMVLVERACGLEDLLFVRAAHHPARRRGYQTVIVVGRKK